MNARARLHRVLHRIGFDILPYSGRYFVARKRMEVLNALDVGLVVDVGANQGQFGQELRWEGWRGPIVSFEPLTDAFERLKRVRDSSWGAYRVALGSSAGTAMLNRSRNSWSSSFLPVTSRHLQASPGSAYTGAERVTMRTLDSFELQGRIYLKVDVQGYELQVLEGATRTLRDAVVALELELSTRSLYEGQALLGEMLDAARSQGFVLLSLAPGFTDSAVGELLQLDGIFAKVGESRRLDPATVDSPIGDGDAQP